MDQHLSDGLRDLVTLTFAFGGHGTARDALFVLHLYTKF